LLILLSESGGLTPIMFDLLNVDLLEVRQANETTLVKQEHTCISHSWIIALRLFRSLLGSV